MFQRPTRFSPGESLALGMGFASSRVMGAVNAGTESSRLRIGWKPRSARPPQTHPRTT